MVPIRLTLEGLYSYQKKQVIDFEQLTQAQLFGIFGATGSGKSSILEAVTLALYGECERLNRKVRNFNLMNLRSNKLTVDLEFSLTGKAEDCYRFVVSGKRHGKHFEKIQYQRQAYQKIGDSWEPLELNTAESLIGLGYEHFKRTIIIPQGKFREFLDMKDTARSEMLNQIFGLDKYRLSPQVKQLIQRNETQKAQQTALIQQYIELNEEGIKELRSSIGKQESELKTRHKKLEEQRKLHTEWEKRQLLYHQYQTLQEQLNALRGKKEEFTQRERDYQQYVSCLNLFREPLNRQAEYGNEIQSLLKTLHAEQELLERWSKELEQKKKSLEEIQKAFSERHLLEEKAAEWKKIIQLKQEETYLFEHLEGRRKKGQELVGQLQENIQKLKADIQATEAEIDQLKEQQPATQEMLAVQQWVQQKQHLQDKLQQAENRKKGLEEEIEESLKKKQALLQDSFLDSRQYDLPAVQITALFQQEIERLGKQIQEVEEKREDVLLKHKMESLSQSLTEGEPCPLCGATHHPNPLNPSSLKREMKHLETFKEKLKEKARNMEGAAPLLMELAEQAIGIRRRGQEMEEQFASLKQEISRMEANRPVLKEEWKEQDFSHMHVQFQEIEDQLKEKEVHVQAIRNRLTDEEEKLASYQETLTNIQQQYSEKHGEFSSHKEGLKQLFFDEQRQQSDTYLQEQALQAEQDFEEIGQLHQQVREQVEQQQNQLKLQEGKYHSLQESYKNLTQKSAHLAQEIQSILKEAPFDTVEQVRAILTLNLNIDVEREAIQSYQKELTHTEGQLKELTQQMGDSPYEPEAHEALKRELQQLEDTYDAFFQELGIQKHRLEQQLKDFQKKKTIQKEIDTLHAREENLKVMQNLFRGDAFVRYVSSAYLENLCSAANERFMGLTRNALSLEIDENNQFYIRDWLNDGKLRSANTLSGGQSFQAALCLALALSDQVQQQVQAQQRFFFLDEGFGALDKESLRLIFFTLQQLQKENRIVGIISHVEELQQEIDTYLHVHNDPELGSQVRGSWEYRD